MLQKKSFLAWFFNEAAENLTRRLATAQQNCTGRLDGVTSFKRQVPQAEKDSEKQ